MDVRSGCQPRSHVLFEGVAGANLHRRAFNRDSVNRVPIFLDSESELVVVLLIGGETALLL